MGTVGRPMTWSVLLGLALFGCTAAADAVLNPEQIQKLMGFGINLGNRIDLGKGQKPRPVLEKYFDAFKAQNFSNVRIPVCWDTHTGLTAPYAIDVSFMDLVESIVDWTLDRGMVAILNTHHEKWLDDPSAFDAKLPRLLAIWTQIADRFKDKDQTLLFEVYNEPHLMTAAQLNTMNSRVLPIIRADNPTRMVLLMGLKFGNPSWHLQNPDGLAIPDDPQVMVELHNYDPFKYAGASPTVHSWGSAADKATLMDWVDGIDAWATKKGVRLYYGEFGCSSDQTHATGRDAWFQAHYAAIQAKGWGASVWSDGSKHTIYDYNDGSWVTDILVDLGRGGPLPPTPPTPPGPPTPSSGGCTTCGYACNGDCSTCKRCSGTQKPFCSSSTTNCLKHCGGDMWCGPPTPPVAPTTPADVDVLSDSVSHSASIGDESCQGEGAADGCPTGSSSDGLSGWTIALIASGSLMLLGAVAGGVWLFYARKVGNGSMNEALLPEGEDNESQQSYKRMPDSCDDHRSLISGA